MKDYYTLKEIILGLRKEQLKIRKKLYELEQKMIVDLLNNMNTEIELLEKELEVLKLQKKGLMQRLLTGEVRVKV